MVAVVTTAMYVCVCAREALLFAYLIILFGKGVRAETALLTLHQRVFFNF